MTRDMLVRMLVGREVSEEYTPPSPRAESDPTPMLEVKHLAREGVLQDISFSVSRGEIFGIYGLVGAGRSEVARAIVGADQKDDGEIRLEGRKLSINSPRDAIRSGICLVPEDRKSQGVLLEKSLAENIALPSLKRMKGFLFLNYAKIFRYASDYVATLKIATPNVNQFVRYLSGGNQQKVVLAKWLGMNLKVFIFDEPTRGIDVGAKEEIRAMIRGLAAEGKAIILISSEIPEILSISDTIAVMHEGSLAAVMPRRDATKEKLVSHSMGASEI
jgi:ribose transport system ATP-binding protein